MSNKKKLTVIPQQIAEWIEQNAETDIEDDATLWINGAKAMYVKCQEQIGELLPGEHADEIHPRAATWLDERRNHLKEVHLLEAYIRELEAKYGVQPNVNPL